RSAFSCGRGVGLSRGTGRKANRPPTRGPIPQSGFAGLGRKSNIMEEPLPPAWMASERRREPSTANRGGRGMPSNEPFGDDGLALLVPYARSGDESLPAERCLQIYRIMVRARAMEERMIKMSKSGQGYFWIGGPGEEAFNACLGLQIKKGQ